MITLICTNCQANLSIDDAFAGGVCRCQHCGTIQTVPAKARDGEVVAAQRALYVNQPRGDAPPGSGTGLDDLADVVASSGLSGLGGSGLQSKRLKSPTRSIDQSAHASPPKKSNAAMLLVLAGAVIVILGGALAYVMLDRAEKNTKSVQQTTVGTVTETVTHAPDKKIDGPAFLDIPLGDAQIVVYLLDRGDGTREYFGELVQATLASIKTLGNDRKFQIIFWNNGEDTEYPRGGPAYAIAENIASAERALEDVIPRGKTEAIEPFRRAISRHPDAIVLATAKGWSLEEGFAQELLAIRGQEKTRIHTVSLGGDDSQTTLKLLATQSGGVSRNVSASQLRGN